MSLVGKMSGVDLARVKAYYKEHPPVKDHMVAPSWREFKTFPGFMHYGFMDMLEGVELPPHLEYLRSWFGTFMSSPNEGEITINCSGAIASHSIEGFEEKTRQENFSQKCLYDVAEALKRYVPGFENAYLSAISGFLGVRESRRVLGDYKVTMDDFMAARDFEDSIGRGRHARRLSHGGRRDHDRVQSGARQVHDHPLSVHGGQGQRESAGSGPLRLL